MFGKKNSIFNKIAGSIKFNDDFEYEEDNANSSLVAGVQKPLNIRHLEGELEGDSSAEDEEGQLTVDVYENPNEIVVQTMVAGVRPEDLSVIISRDSVTIRGRREENRTVNDDSYHLKELYWGSFSRTVMLPNEIDTDNAEAIERHGLLVLRLPKIDKARKTTVKVKSI